VIVFTSDNGFYFGEHGIPDGKELPYEPALRVPLAVFVPESLGGDGGRVSDALVSNVDVAPTLLDYSGARPCSSRSRCRTVDGRSLRPLLAGGDPRWTQGRAIPLELDADFAYTAFRDEETLYMELTRDPIGPLAKPEIELYDLRSDPYELQNLAVARGDKASNLPAQHRRLIRLTSCMGNRGPGACP
jgi:arylsulfatase A-like enzyme